jgi:sialidase-1
LGGRFAGVHNGALILAGGSHFPKSLFEGGEKVFSDRIDVLETQAGGWRSEFRLERPLAQGASVSTPEGIICLGGGDANRNYATVFRLRWTGSRIERDRLPDLPRPYGFLGAAKLGTAIYVAGGTEAPAATEASRRFWRLDLAAKKPRWEELPPLPGVGRIGAAVVAQAGGIYVVSGASLSRGPDGKPIRTYLQDAFRYRPGDSWQRVADLPGPSVAAPATAYGTRHLLIFGGDNGENATRVQEFKDRHPGFRRDLLVYDTAADRWQSLPDLLPVSLVTTNAVRWGDAMVIPGGEDRPAHRSPSVLMTKSPLRGGGTLAMDTPVETTLFVSGTEDYHTFRIPSLLVTKRGTLLAFCEGRKNGSSDAGRIDTVLRRSTDGGQTWSPLQVLWNDGENTCGNPCPVQDEETGAIHLLLTHNLGEDKESEIHAGTSKGTRTVWVCHSDDEGMTWTTPRDITKTTKLPDWTWYATGPGIGIQIKKGPRKGRLVIPCDHNIAETRQAWSHVIYSDDRGKTWKIGGNAAQDHTNESQVTELSDGRLMLNSRSTDRSKKFRGISYSADGGDTWTDFRYDNTLIEPICQACLLACTPGDGSHLLLFSNPAETEARKNLTVRLSRDDGKTWHVSRTLYPGPAAYSNLAVLPDGNFACLYECGKERPYETITFARFSMGWLTNDGSTAAR